MLDVEAKIVREKIRTQVWTSYVKDAFHLTNLIQTKGGFSYAILVMDRIGGWNEGRRYEDGSQIGGRLAANMWTSNKAVIRIGEKAHVCLQKIGKVLDAGGHQCIRVQENPEWISEFSLVVQEHTILEALNYDTDVPCVVQWRMLWYSAPSSFNHDLLNDVLLAKHNKAINMAIEAPFSFPLWRRHTRRSSFFEAQRLTMMHCLQGCMWRPEREMKGWDLGGRPDLLPENEDDGRDTGPDEF